jgi:hypothetical protein
VKVWAIYRTVEEVVPGRTVFHRDTVRRTTFVESLVDNEAAARERLEELHRILPSYSWGIEGPFEVLSVSGVPR